MKRNINNTKIGLIGIGLILAWTISIMLPSNTKQHDDELSKRPTKPSHRIEVMNQIRDEVQRLESQNASLEEIDSNLQSRIESLQQQLAVLDQRLLEKSQTTTQNDDSRQIEHGLSDQSTVKNTPKETAEAEMKKAEALMEEQTALLEDTLYQEEADPAWSKWAENELNQSFNKPEAEGLTLVDAHCKGTLCRVELSGEATTNLEETLSRLPELAPWEAHGFVEVNGIDDPDVLPEVVIYMAREGHTLPEINN